MRKNARFVAIAVGLVLLLGVGAVFVGPREESRQPLPISFGGWTNIAGDRYARLIFPAVMQKSPGHNFLLKRTYRIEFDVQTQLRDGSSTTNAFRDRVGVPVGRPLVAELLLKIDPDVLSLSIRNPTGILGGYWDNDILGWKPPSPPLERVWEFIPPPTINCD